MAHFIFLLVSISWALFALPSNLFPFFLGKKGFFFSLGIFIKIKVADTLFFSFSLSLSLLGQVVTHATRYRPLEMGSLKATFAGAGKTRRADTSNLSTNLAKT